MTTPNPRNNPNSSEYDPSLARHERNTALSSEEIAGYNASLYGFTEAPVRTVESYGTEGVANTEVNRLLGEVPGADTGEVAVDADHVAHDALVFENKANEMLTEVRLGESSNDTNVTTVQATQMALAEQLDAGTESTNEEKRQAEHALLAATFARAIEKGDLAPIQSLEDAGIARDINYRLDELRKQYGSASYASLDELAVVGALIYYAKKTSPEDDDKIIESKNGHVEIESIDELSAQAREGDADAMQQLVESDKASEILDATQQAKLIAEYGSLEQVPIKIWEEMTTEEGLRKDDITLAA